MEAATYYRFKPQLATKTSLRTLSEEFLKSYLELMETQEATMTDYKNGGERKGFLSWSEKMERISKLKWLYPIYNLDQYGMLDQFLSPRILMQVAKDKYDEGNRVKASQLRTHIGVLLQLVKNLFSPALSNGFEKKNVERIKEKVEHQLVHYITHYTTEDPASGKVDLFSTDREESLYSSADEALLPQLAIIINGSGNRQEIISALQKSCDLVKLLTICEFITSQGIRHTLLKEAKKADILPNLSHLWVPEVQSILLKISKYPELIDMLEECLVYYEINVTDKKPMPNDVKIAYHIRMLLAYMKKDLTALEKEAIPQGVARDSQELSLAEYKDFYRALILIVDDPKEAHDIFTELSAKYRKHSGLAVNRLTAAFNLAEKEGTTAGFATALEEWKESSAVYSEQELLSLEPELSIILLNLYHQLNQHEKLDTLFMQLDMPYKMLPGVLEVWIDNLLKRNRRAEAFYWADQAKQYHEFDGQDELPFLQQLNDKISGEEKIDELVVQYNRIFNSPAELLVKILPLRINGKTSLVEFSVQEFVLAADVMLDKIKSISAIKDEDKYNDLMEALLEGRINSYGWKVSGQKRGGYSGAKGPNPGERDLPVYGADNKIIINGEALIYRGMGTAIPHLNKLFDYTHQRGTLLVIFYDTGERGNDFEGNWQTYQDAILPACDFPDGYEPVGKFEDVTIEFKMVHSAIKIGKTRLKSGSVIYHIFIKINYSVAL